MSSTGTRIGTEVAGYRLERLLGRGGMSVVYLAEHTRLGRKVALKLLSPALSEDEHYRERFVRESRRAAQLDHPSIIPIYDAGEDDGHLYIAMRYVEGADLKDLIKREGRLPVGRTLFLLEQIAGALDAAHEHDLVHRDVKPSNILIAEPSDRVYLTDFGVVKHTATRGLTKTGFFIGTVDYAAPEQIEGLPLDGRTDVYSLGAVLYECLTGHPPFTQDSELAIMHAHLSAPPPRLSQERPDLPRDLDRVVISALAKSKEDRPATCEELIQTARLVALQRTPTVSQQHMAPEPEPAPATATAAAADVVAEPAVPATSATTPPAPTPLAAEPTVTEAVSAEAPAAPPPTAPVAQPTTPPPSTPAGGGGRRFTASPWFAALLAAVVGAGIAGIAVYFATRGHSTKTAASTAGTTQSTPTTAPPVAKGLAGVIPNPVWKNCAVQTTPAPGALESAVCLPPSNSTVFFPDRVTLSLYPNSTALFKAYNALRLSNPNSAKLQPGKGFCSQTSWGSGNGPWLHGPGKPGGHRYCFFDTNSDAVIVWTHEKLGQPTHIDLLGTARVSGSDHFNLINWWGFWHHRLGKCETPGCVAQLP